MIVTIHEHYNKVKVFEGVHAIEQRGMQMVLIFDGYERRIMLGDMMYAEILQEDKNE